MGFHLKIMNYRKIRSADFNPDGVCLLVGPNGSGKSTLLSAIELLRNTFERGFDTAINLAGGHWISNLDLPDRPTTFKIGTSDLQWNLYIEDSICVEKVTQGDFGSPLSVFLLKDIYDKKNDLTTNIDSPKLENFIRILTQYRNYHDYHLWQLRKSGSQAGSESELHSRGQNAFSVLRNWHTSRPLRERYDFVINGLREAFPSFFDDLDFESAGQTVTIRIYPPHSDIPVPVYFASNGFLAAMLHLMAVCSAPDGGIVGIDEPENSLHPYAIKMLINAFRERAEERDLTVLLATHSGFMLNRFKNEAHRVYVMDQNEEEQLVRLDAIRDPEWLKYFSLGDLYGNDFAIQEQDAEADDEHN
jgi:predicted ATPase